MDILRAEAIADFLIFSTDGSRQVIIGVVLGYVCLL